MYLRRPRQIHAINCLAADLEADISTRSHPNVKDCEEQAGRRYLLHVPAVVGPRVHTLLDTVSKDTMIEK